MPNNLVFNNVASQLEVQIFGYDGRRTRAVKTDTSGRLEITGTFTATGTITAITTETVIELKTQIKGGTGTGTALTVDTLHLSSYSFFIHNTGSSIFKIWLQISPEPEDSLFVDDISGEMKISTGSRQVLIPRHYLKFTRLRYKSLSGPVNADVWFNGRG